MKPYCTQNQGDCSTCSLVSYNRDCRNNPIRGGARPGAGRKPSDNPRVSKTIRFSEQEWEKVLAYAQELNIIPSEYIRRMALKEEK